MEVPVIRIITIHLCDIGQSHSKDMSLVQKTRMHGRGGKPKQKGQVLTCEEPGVQEFARGCSEE